MLQALFPCYRKYLLRLAPLLCSYLYCMPNIEKYQRNEEVIISHCVVDFYKGNYKDLYRRLEGHSFSPDNFPKLQQLWLKAHYNEASWL